MTERKLILVTGPSSVFDFLEKLAETVRSEGVDVVHISDLKTPSDYVHWDDVNVLVPYATPCRDRDMGGAPKLRAIITPSLGYEGVDVSAATRRGILVANGQAHENYQSVAEAAVMLTLMAT